MSYDGYQGMTQQPGGEMLQQPTKDERMWAMLCHLLAFAGLFVPLGNIIAPLVVWLLKKEESRFVDDQGKESINFQISMTIYSTIAAVLTTVIIGIPILIALIIADIVLIIIAGIKANDGYLYKYPITIRLVK